MNFTGFSHARMSSVPPAWIFTGTACDEMAIEGLTVEAVESMITVPPKISAPLCICWSVWLFVMWKSAAPYFTSFGYVPFPVIGAGQVIFVVSLETMNVSEM